MRKPLRPWRVLVLVLLLVAVAGYGLCRAMHPSWADSEAWQKYQRIRFGMTRDEALAVFAPQPPEADFEANVRWSPHWGMGGDEIEVMLDGGDHVWFKRATIRGHTIIEVARERHWWDRWRVRLGW